MRIDEKKQITTKKCTIKSAKKKNKSLLNSLLQRRRPGNTYNGLDYTGHNYRQSLFMRRIKVRAKGDGGRVDTAEPKARHTIGRDIVNPPRV